MPSSLAGSAATSLWPRYAWRSLYFRRDGCNLVSHASRICSGASPIFGPMDGPDCAPCALTADAVWTCLPR